MNGQRHKPELSISRPDVQLILPLWREEVGRDGQADADGEADKYAVSVPRNWRGVSGVRRMTAAKRARLHNGMRSLISTLPSGHF